MIKTSLTTLLFILTLFRVNGQMVVTDLYGFKLGQYRVTATNEFGKPVQQGKFEDGFEYETFLIEYDPNVYMVFEYSAKQPDVIWSIQVMGNNETTDIGFKGLRLGIDKKQVERLIGKPDKKESISEHGERWNYSRANYSVEISQSGKLSSVKIKNNYLNEVPDVSKLAKIEDVIQQMSSPFNSDIVNILAPGIEIYTKDTTLFFSKPIKTEIQTDYSKIFQTIRELSIGLNKINTSDIESYEENNSHALGQNPKHVIKINTGHKIKEIVFEYINGQYLIGGINAK